MRPVPDFAVALVAEFEGLRLKPYRCSAGYATIGYGRLLSRDRSVPLDAFPPIDRATAEAWLRQDLTASAGAVCRLCPGIVAENVEHRFAALLSFAFNLGPGALQASRLRARVNERDYAAASAEFPRWVHAAGRRVRGLEIRREIERAVFDGLIQGM